MRRRLKIPSPYINYHELPSDQYCQMRSICVYLPQGGEEIPYFLRLCDALGTIILSIWLSCVYITWESYWKWSVYFRMGGKTWLEGRSTLPIYPGLIVFYLSKKCSEIWGSLPSNVPSFKGAVNCNDLMQNSYSQRRGGIYTTPLRCWDALRLGKKDLITLWMLGKCSNWSW
jgi:hypothetical protein